MHHAIHSHHFLLWITPIWQSQDTHIYCNILWWLLAKHHQNLISQDMWMERHTEVQMKKPPHHAFISYTFLQPFLALHMQSVNWLSSSQHTPITVYHYRQCKEWKTITISKTRICCFKDVLHVKEGLIGLCNSVSSNQLVCAWIHSNNSR